LIKKGIKIISGGQTGADRAALDVAVRLGLPYGGAIPKGRLTEDGPLSDKYKGMVELDTSEYPVRTERNVVDSDATLIFTLGAPDRGTSLTIKLAKKYRKPFLIINIKEEEKIKTIEKIKKWLKDTSPHILNVAGSRESHAKGIYEKVFNILMKVFEVS